MDIIIKGKTYEDVPAVELPSPGGGFARFVDPGAIPWNWMGEDAECIDDSVHSFSAALEDTDYAAWTPSTTAVVIVASETKTARAIDTGEYDYLLRWQFSSDIVYAAGTTMKATPVRQVSELWQAIIKRPSSYANLKIPTYTGNACITMMTAPIIDYHNTSGTHTMAWTGSYGFYQSAVAATFSSSTSDKPNLTIKTPTISARCNSSYFAVARGSDVDQALSTVRLKGELWRMKKSNTVEAMYASAVELYNSDF